LLIKVSDVVAGNFGGKLFFIVFVFKTLFLVSHIFFNY
jgi:hypothetical protein